MSDITDPGRKSRRAAREASRLQKDQQKKEKLKLAEADSEIERRRALASGGGGRASLLRTSPTGLGG